MSSFLPRDDDSVRNDIYSLRTRARERREQQQQQNNANFRENADREDDHARGGVFGHDRQRESEDPR